MQFFRRFSLIGCGLVIGLTGLSAAEDFSFEKLCEKARKLAETPATPPTLELADFWKKLSYDQHRDIRFKMESGLWADEKGPFSIDFFHPGWTAKKMVSLAEVAEGKATSIQFDPKLFD